MNYSEALLDLGDMVAPTLFPALTTEEIARALERAKLKDSNGWSPDVLLPAARNTAYAMGALAIPPERNGFYYQVNQAGTTDATSDPSWPETVGGSVPDGSVVWINAGAAPWLGAYDLNYAASLLWELKANKVAGLTDITADGQHFTQGDLLAHFTERAKYYRARRGIQSVRYSSVTAVTSPRRYY